MRTRFLVTSLSVLAFSITVIAQTTWQTEAAPSDHTAVATKYGKLPLSFEANRGQSDAQVKFIARGSGYGLFLTSSEAVLALHTPAPGEARAHGKLAIKPGKNETDIVRMQLRGANPSVNSAGVDPLPGTANYFLGNDPSKWQTNIPTYSKVKFDKVYPGVDLVYYGNQSQLEYDFVVAPNANPNTIRLHFAGANELWLTSDGDLTMSARHGQIAFHKPVIYQEANGQRQPIVGKFALLARGDVGFTLGNYNHSENLIIDPVLAYSTYLGGSSNDQANAIAVDASGSAYITGYTSSIDFPVTKGAFQTTIGGTYGNAFVSKLNPDGSALIYSTFLGGSGSNRAGDFGEAVAIDSSGDAYVAGATASADFPVTQKAFQITNNAVPKYTGFVAKLNSTGSGLIYSTYFGGSDGDSVDALVIDSSGNAHLGGVTGATGFPVTKGAFQTTEAPSEDGTGFVAELNASGTGLVYSTFFGEDTGVTALAVDSAGDTFIVGSTASFGFTVTPGAFQPAASKYSTGSTGFVSKLNPAGSGLLYSTFLGGSGNENYGDVGESVTLDHSGNAYIAGFTGSFDFPVTAGAFQTINKDPSEAATGFVTKMNSTGTALIYSTYLGGSGFLGKSEAVKGIVIDSTGSAFVTGHTFSNDFPVTSGAFETTNPAGFNNESAFITNLNATGTGLLYSTYLGSFSYSQFSGASAAGIAMDSSGYIYIAGSVYAAFSFPVSAGSFQVEDKNIDSSTAFVTKLSLNPPQPTFATVTSASASKNSQLLGQPVSFTAKVASAEASYSPVGMVLFSVDYQPAATLPLDETGSAVYTTSSLAEGYHHVQAFYLSGGDFGPSDSNRLDEDIVSDAAPTFSPAPGQYIGSVLVTLADISPGVTIQYTLDNSTPTTSSPIYSQPILVSGYTVIKAIAVRNGMTSDISQTAYSVAPQTPTPIISPVPGSYPSGQHITITDAISTATIRYTTDGSTPTTHSNYYDKPIVLTGAETIKAIAVSTGDANSNVTSAAYTVN